MKQDSTIPCPLSLSLSLSLYVFTYMCCVDSKVTYSLLGRGGNYLYTFEKQQQQQHTHSGMPSELFPRASAAASGAASSSLSRLVPQRLRIRHQSFLLRRGGYGTGSVKHQRQLPASCTSVEYTEAYLAPYKHLDDSLHHCPRLIDAESIHGDEQQFWRERRQFRRSGARATYMPMWDRQAQVALMMIQRVRRAPAAAAFRLMTLALRMTLLPRIVAGLAGPLLTAQVGLQAAGMGALRDNIIKAAEEKKKDKKSGTEGVNAAAEEEGANGKNTTPTTEDSSSGAKKEEEAPTTSPGTS
eukprot:gene7889-5514_t